jgi:DNA-binding LytR/AlgR family response regulator
MIRAIALDDEPLALEVIKSFCNAIDFISLEKCFTSAKNTMDYINNFPVDLLFLDVQMPDISGLDFYKKTDGNMMVIFITAHSQYAIEGFEVNAVDYLLKPLQFSRFELACQKAKEFYDYQVRKNSQSGSFLFVRSEYSLVKIMLSDILYIETMDDYLKIHQLGKKPIITLMSIRKLMDRLPEKEFVRIHRSYVVPLNKIESVRAKSVFLGVAELPIGATFEKEFFRIFSDNSN